MCCEKLTICGSCIYHKALNFWSPLFMFILVQKFILVIKNILHLFTVLYFIIIDTFVFNLWNNYVIVSNNLIIEWFTAFLGSYVIYGTLFQALNFYQFLHPVLTYGKRYQHNHGSFCIVSIYQLLPTRYWLIQS